MTKAQRKERQFFQDVGEHGNERVAQTKDHGGTENGHVELIFGGHDNGFALTL